MPENTTDNNSNSAKKHDKNNLGTLCNAFLNRID